MASKDPHRRLIYLSTASVCKQVGFASATDACLETLSELLQAHLSEFTRTCRKFSELSHRTTPDMTDVKMALAEVGGSVSNIHQFSRQARNHPISVGQMRQPPEHRTLKSGLAKVAVPSYIPAYFPEFPEVHSFVRTPAIREPVRQYQVVRERMSTQRRTTEEAMVKYLFRTNPSDFCLYQGVDQNAFPTANLTLDPWPYTNALIHSKECAGGNENNSQPVEESLSTPQSSQNSAVSSGGENIYVKEAKRQRSTR